ncbi:MAG: hypothetical protein QOE33_3819 [Acidobacteriota bacterium]|nr:hypothetical protein [Acidobacteriota bacterium]
MLLILRFDNPWLNTMWPGLLLDAWNIGLALPFAPQWSLWNLVLDGPSIGGILVGFIESTGNRRWTLGRTRRQMTRRLTGNRGDRTETVTAWRWGRDRWDLLVNIHVAGVRGCSRTVYGGGIWRSRVHLYILDRGCTRTVCGGGICRRRVHVYILITM